MAPEQLRNVRAADSRSDIYSLGVILYRAFAGRLPYDADTLPALVLQIVDARAVHLTHLRPDLDPSLCDVVMRAMAQDPADRFANIGEFARALEPFAGVRFEHTSPTIVSSGRSVPNLKPLRTPASGPRINRDLPPTQSDSAQVQAVSKPVDTGRPSTEAVPTPITGLKPHPERRRTYWLLAGALALLSVGVPVVWLARRGEGEPSSQKLPPPLPERASGIEPKPATDKSNVPQALPPAPTVEPSVQVPTPAPTTGQLAEAHGGAPESARGTHEERKAHRAAKAAAEVPGSAEAAEPQKTPSAPAAEKPGTPAGEHEHGDPTLNNDSNPYLQR
jgi:serine/threonine protein kinase